MRQIEKILQEIAREEKLNYQSFANGWILRVGEKFVTGYQFAINDAAASRLCDDKSATYECLRGAGIPAIPHYFFMDLDKPRLAQIRSANGELVLKPNNASGGADVVQATTIEEVFQNAEKILSKSESLAVSPFVKFKNEFRIIVLDGVVQLMYRKHIQGDGWKHNLGLGALAEQIEYDENLVNLALKTAALLGIHFASVDIAQTDEGFKVLEVNSGVMMEHFSAQSDKNYQIAKKIYRKAITGCA